MNERPEADPVRICYDCRREGLTGDDFHVGQSVCKPCNYARVKAWRHANPEKCREQDRKRKANKRRRAKLEANVDLMQTEVIECPSTDSL